MLRVEMSRLQSQVKSLCLSEQLLSFPGRSLLALSNGMS